MKGLRKYIAPFAPDQSGAAAVFCELGGLVIILDAGGCAGNICGFDEPRWFASKSAIFSAGLRDMDAILGRDDKLVEKIEMACRKIRGNFVAVIGTPVPAVIGTDYTALRRMIEKKTGLPALTVDTNGMDLYDEGVRKAFLELFRTGEKKEETVDGNHGAAEDVLSPEGRENGEKCLGIIGATPLDVFWEENGTSLEEHYKQKGWKTVYSYGMGTAFSTVAQAGFTEENLVIAPAGLTAAKYLQKKYNTPYRAAYPLETLPDWEGFWERLINKERKKILLVHQQVLANTLRERLEKETQAEVTVASWFMLEKELAREGDIHLREEDQWISLVREGEYDLIIGDELFARAIPFYEGDYVPLAHFAVSGKRKP